MHSTHRPTPRHWDGSPVVSHRGRVLTIAANCPSRLLRIAQRGACRDCGNRIDWHTTTDKQPVALHPMELPARAVPEPLRWHVASGIAHPADDASGWCRTAHTILCPARAAPQPPSPALDHLRRRLALHTRRLLDTGAFTPRTPPTAPGACRPERPVVQLLYGRYLAAHPIDDIQCVAQTRRRTRCHQPVLDPAAPGHWILTPAVLRRHRQLALPAVDIAVYDLGGLPYAEQLRWRTQRCPIHAITTGAADLALAEWEPFDPIKHHAHLATRLPRAVRRTSG